jgi:hypothetical protein
VQELITAKEIQREREELFVGGVQDLQYTVHTHHHVDEGGDRPRESLLLQTLQKNELQLEQLDLLLMDALDWPFAFPDKEERLEETRRKED